MEESVILQTAACDQDEHIEAEVTLEIISSDLDNWTEFFFMNNETGEHLCVCLSLPVYLSICLLV